MKKLLMILPLVLLLCFMVGCQDKEAIAELEAMKAQAEVEEQNKEIVLRLYEEIDKRNIDAVIEIWAPDARIYTNGGFEPRKPENLKPLFSITFIAFPDFVASIEDVIAKGDKVTARMIYTGTHKGEVMGYPPTGNTVKYLAIHTHTIKDGKIVESWVLEDSLFMFRQLGMELKPKEE
jgi:steroid delta-isomerase-like uncharacterized protein